ncbi:hypothetical protein UlMin_023691 [Ulmus minor]
MAHLSLSERQALRKKNIMTLFMHWLHVMSVVQHFYKLLEKIVERHLYVFDIATNRQIVHELVYETDANCVVQLRVNRLAFTNLCTMLESRDGLRASKYLQIDEQVAIFLHIISHHIKNIVIKFQFLRSKETVSKYYHNVLHSVIQLHRKLLQKFEPVPENSIDERWKWFKSHKEAAPFKIKSFPYYEELSMIFGKDRAIGQHIETPVDVEEQLQNIGEDYPGDDADFNSSNNMKNASDNNVDDQFISLAPKRSQSQTECSSRYRKQKKSKSIGDLVDTIKESTLTRAAVIEKSYARLSKAMGEDMNKKHMKLGKELSKTTTLSIMERHKVFKLIVQDNAMISCFFNLPDELKDDWVKGMLVGTIYMVH